jgi:hypothetical protein
MFWFNTNLEHPPTPRKRFDFRMGSDSFKFKFKVFETLNPPIKYLY